MTQITEFYIDRPRMLGVRGWSLLIPSALAAVGFCAFSVLAFSFTELQTLPVAFRRDLVIVGSFALAIGGEMGTLSGVVEVFRKRRQAEVWDWLAILVSAMSTVAAFVLSWAALLGATATWSRGVQMYGPIVLGVLAALDSYAGFSELGMYLSTYDERMADWQARYDEFKRALLAAQWETEHATRNVNQMPEVPAALVVQQHTGAPAPVLQHDTATLPAKVQALIDYYASHPLATQAEAGSAVGRSRQWAGARLAELEESGFIHRNGNGVELL